MSTCLNGHGPWWPVGTKPDKLTVHSISSTRQTAFAVVSKEKLKIKWLLNWLYLKQYYSINIYQVFFTTLQEKKRLEVHFSFNLNDLKLTESCVTNWNNFKFFEVFQGG